jgi:competence transcription factor ComK
MFVFKFLLVSIRQKPEGGSNNPIVELAFKNLENSLRGNKLKAKRHTTLVHKTSTLAVDDLFLMAFFPTVCVGGQ